MENITCPICGEPMENRMKLGSHMWSKHKVKLKEYEAQQAGKLDEAKSAEALFKPQPLKECREIITEAPAMKVDKSILKEKEKVDTDFVSKEVNPYKDLYRDGGTVLNEFLSR